MPYATLTPTQEVAIETCSRRGRSARLRPHRPSMRNEPVFPRTVGGSRLRHDDHHRPSHLPHAPRHREHRACHLPRFALLPKVAHRARKGLCPNRHLHRRRAQRPRGNSIAGIPKTPVSQNRDSELASSARENRYSQRSPKYDGDPAFSVGDAVLTRHIDPSGHTRIPRYAQGKHGVVHALRGVYDLLDLKVQGVRKPEPVYTVGFDARELWGDEAESPQRVYIDLWESYLLSPQ